LLKVHQSNFRMLGFTESASVGELARLAREHRLLLVHDLGSGALRDPRRAGHPAETTVPESLAAGADVVAFSGDKLLGGPQAGMLVGRHDAIDPMRRHPLLRALRLDKLSLAALEATLLLYQDGREDTLPVPRAMAQSESVLRQRAEHVAARLGRWARIDATTGFAGGGSLPGDGIPSIGVSLCVADPSPEQLAARLRAHRPAVVGRTVDGNLLLDMLTVDDSELADLVAAVREAVGPCGM
jgi:L-seryl-tRNA(Ser) seleniumtransferase